MRIKRLRLLQATETWLAFIFGEIMNYPKGVERVSISCPTCNPDTHLCNQFYGIIIVSNDCLVTKYVCNVVHTFNLFKSGKYMKVIIYRIVYTFLVFVDIVHIHTIPVFC